MTVPNDGDFTPREISRALTRLESDIDRRLQRIEGRLESSTFVDQRVYHAETLVQAERDKSFHARLQELEESQKWIFRSVIIAILGFVFNLAIVFLTVQK